MSARHKMLAALTKPPHLAADLSHGDGSNYHENWTYQAERSNSGSTIWTSGLAENTETRRWNGLKDRIDGMKTLRWRISGDEGGCDGLAPLLSGMAGASEFRRVLETVVD